MPDLTGRIEGEKMGLFGKKKVDFVSLKCWVMDLLWI